MVPPSGSWRGPADDMMMQGLLSTLYLCIRIRSLSRKLWKSLDVPKIHPFWRRYASLTTYGLKEAGAGSALNAVSFKINMWFVDLDCGSSDLMKSHPGGKELRKRFKALIIDK